MPQTRLRYAIRDRSTEPEVRLLIVRALAGASTPDAPIADRVIWDDAGDQVLVHLDSVVVKLVKQFLFVSAEFETDQTGRGTLIVSLAFGSTEDGASLVATTTDVPHGQPVLAARWGRTFQEIVWAALLSSARQHATERGKVPVSLHVLDGALRFGAAPPLDLTAAALETFDTRFPGRRDRTRR